MNKITLIFIVLFSMVISAFCQMTQDKFASLIDNEKYESVISILSKNSDENISINYWMGRAEYGLKHYKKAAELFEKSIENNEIGKFSLLWLARSQRNSGEQIKAMENFSRIYKIDNTNQEIIGEYAAIKALNGEYLEASNLFSRITIPELRQKADKWRDLLKPLAESMKLEPKKLHVIDGMIVCADDEKNIAYIEDVALQAKYDIEKKIAVQLPSFRLLIFSDKSSFLKYSASVHNRKRALNSPSFTLPGVLAIWNPVSWETPPHNKDEVPGIMKHEMMHLAISVLTHGESIPLWLNEGLACKFGGGIQNMPINNIPEISLVDLDSALNSTDDKIQLLAYCQALRIVDLIVENMNIDDIHQMLILLADNEKLDIVIDKVARKSLKDIVIIKE